MLKWLYSKMIAGYSPMVPTLGTMSTLSMASIMIIGGPVLKIVLHHRRRGEER